MTKISKTLVLVFLMLAANFVMAQSPYYTVADNGQTILVNPGSSTTPPNAPGTSLTTTFASNNGFAGNMFDLEVIGSIPITISSLDVNIDGSTCEIYVYYRTGTYVGNEYSSTGWTLVDAVSGVVPQGLDNPTNVDIANLTLDPGTTYGFYVTVHDYPSASMQYTNGSNVYADSNLELTAGIGKGNPDFTGSNFDPRTWNGTIHYTVGSAVPVNYWAIIVVFMLTAGFVVIRFRRS